MHMYIHIQLSMHTNEHIPCIVLYCIVLCCVQYLYSAPQQPWANRGAFGSVSSKKRDKFEGRYINTRLPYHTIPSCPDAKNRS